MILLNRRQFERAKNAAGWSYLTVVSSIAFAADYIFRLQTPQPIRIISHCLRRLWKSDLRGGRSIF